MSGRCSSGSRADLSLGLRALSSAARPGRRAAEMGSGIPVWVPEDGPLQPATGTGQQLPVAGRHPGRAVGESVCRSVPPYGRLHKGNRAAHLHLPAREGIPGRPHRKPLGRGRMFFEKMNRLVTIPQGTRSFCTLHPASFPVDCRRSSGRAPELAPLQQALDLVCHCVSSVIQVSRVVVPLRGRSCDSGCSSIGESFTTEPR